MSLYNKLILINLKKTKLIILNLLLIFFIYFFSFNILPKFSNSNEYEFKNIIFNKNNIDYINRIVTISFNDILPNTLFIENNKKFITEYFNYISNDPNILKTPNCPKSILENNMRAVNIVFPKTEVNKISIKFKTHKFNFEPNEKLKINECFNFLFIDNLNKFYQKNFELFVETLQDVTNQYINYKIYSLNKCNMNSDSDYLISFITLIDQIEDNKIPLLYLDLENKITGGLDASGKKFKVKQSNNVILLEKLFKTVLEKKTLNKIKLIIENKKNEKSLNYCLDANWISIKSAELNDAIMFLKSEYNFLNNNFINNNQKYTKNFIEEKKISSLLSFIILLTLVAIMQIYYKSNKKKITKVFKEFLKI